MDKLELKLSIPENIELYRWNMHRDLQINILPYWTKGQSERRYVNDETFNSSLEQENGVLQFFTIDFMLELGYFQKPDEERLRSYIETLVEITYELDLIVQETGLTREEVYANRDHRQAAYKNVFKTKEEAIRFEQLHHNLFRIPKEREIDARYPEMGIGLYIRTLAKNLFDAIHDFCLERVEKMY